MQAKMQIYNTMCNLFKVQEDIADFGRIYGLNGLEFIQVLKIDHLGIDREMFVVL